MNIHDIYVVDKTQLNVIFVKNLYLLIREKKIEVGGRGGAEICRGRSRWGEGG